MWFEWKAVCGAAVSLLMFSACAPSSQWGDTVTDGEDSEANPASAAPSPASDWRPSGTATTPTPGFDPANPDWPLRYQELYDAYLAEHVPPQPGSRIEVYLEGDRIVEGVLLELGAEDVLLATATGELRLGMDALQPRSQAKLFGERHAHFFARHRARQEYEAWAAARNDSGGPAEVRPDVPVHPRNTEGVAVDPLHPPRPVVRRNGGPPVNEPPAGRVRQVEAYILRNAASPESLRVHYWGRVQPHGEGFTVRVRYSLQGAAGFGLSNEDMIFFMYSDGTVYQRAAFRGQ